MLRGALNGFYVLAKPQILLCSQNGGGNCNVPLPYMYKPYSHFTILPPYYITICVLGPIYIVKSTPSNLHHQIYTIKSTSPNLHHQIYTIKSTSSNLHHQIYIIKSTSSNLHHQIYIIKSTPSNLHHQIYIIKSTPSNLHHQIYSPWKKWSLDLCCSPLVFVDLWLWGSAGASLPWV